MSEEQNSDVGGIAADRLRSLIERIERLEEEKKAISSDIRDIYAEAKGAPRRARIFAGNLPQSLGYLRI